MKQRCGKCNREIKNLETAHECDGVFYGPSCSKKLSIVDPNSEFDGHNGEYADAGIKHKVKVTEEIWKESEEYSKIPYLDFLDVASEIKDERFDLFADVFLGNGRSGNSVFEFPAHPKSVEKIDTEFTIYSKRPSYKATGIKAPKKNNLDDIKLNFTRSIFSYCKLFDDPSLNKKTINAYRSQQLEFISVMPVDLKPADYEGGTEFACFTIGSSHEQAKYDRQLMITVLDNGWMEVTPIVVRGKNLVPLFTKRLEDIGGFGLRPTVHSRSGVEACQSDVILHKVIQDWLFLDKPLDSEFLNKWNFVEMKHIQMLKEFKDLHSFTH